MFNFEILRNTHFSVVKGVESMHRSYLRITFVAALLYLLHINFVLAGFGEEAEDLIVWKRNFNQTSSLSHSQLPLFQSDAFFNSSSPLRQFLNFKIRNLLYNIGLLNPAIFQTYRFKENFLVNTSNAYETNDLPANLSVIKQSPGSSGNPTPPFKTTTRILAIDGGGIRGVIPAKILSNMEDLSQRELKSDMYISEYFDFVAGTSTGGILALGLNVPNKDNYNRPKIRAKEILDLYMNHGNEIFPNISLFGNIIKIGNPKYDATNLENLFQRYFGNTALKKSVSRVLITSYDVVQDKPAFFRSYDILKNSFSMKHVARATSAAPTYFSGAVVKDGIGMSYHYIDGGVCTNNPTFAALLEVRKLERESALPRADRYVILSLGTGEAASTNYWDKIKNGGMGQWGFILPFLMMKASEQLVNIHLEMFISDLKAQGIECEYIRIQPHLAAEHALLDDASSSNLQKLTAIAQSAFDTYKPQLRDMLSVYHEESAEKKGYYLNDINPTNNYNLGLLKRKQGKIDDAIKYLTNAAQENHTPAQYELGLMYELGSKNNKYSSPEKQVQASKATSSYTEAAEQGHRDALYKLGKRSSDPKKRKEFYEKAIRQGHIKAHYGRAQIFEQENNKHAAESQYKEASDKGHIKAKYKLGLLMEDQGRWSEAKKWYEDAAECGYIPAHCKLKELKDKFSPINNSSDPFEIGVTYYLGRGVAKDYQEAYKYFHEAAEKGHTVAQFNLGIMYTNGQGVPQDDKEAVKWYRKSADQGYANAQFNLGIRYTNGQGVPQDYQEAYKYFHEAAEKGHTVAQFNLGIMYTNGQGVPQDDKEAVKWYRKSADQGYANAQFNLGIRYANGQGVPQDDKEAVKWYRKSADQGYANAQLYLGIMYAEGRGVPKNDKEAVKWYRKSADQGNVVAQKLLGAMYAEGRGIPKDGV